MEWKGNMIPERVEGERFISRRFSLTKEQDFFSTLILYKKSFLSFVFPNRQCWQNRAALLQDVSYAGISVLDILLHSD